MVTSKRIGGIRFIRLGRYSVTLSRVASPRPTRQNGLTVMADIVTGFALTGMALTVATYLLS